MGIKFEDEDYGIEGEFDDDKLVKLRQRIGSSDESVDVCMRVNVMTAQIMTVHPSLRTQKQNEFMKMIERWYELAVKAAEEEFSASEEYYESGCHLEDDCKRNIEDAS